LTSNLPEGLLASHEVPLDVQSELARLAPRLGRMAHRILWLETAGSTNDIATRLADLGADEGTVVVAETQTAGRGRIGRAWFSPPGAGLYVSVILRPSPGADFSPRENPTALLTLASGVALAEGVQAATGLPAEIKWPNDLIVAKRKLAGILAEAAAQGAALHFIVLGFGVNLRPAAYPPELTGRVTSVEAGRSLRRFSWRSPRGTTTCSTADSMLFWAPGASAQPRCGARRWNGTPAGE
jgi:BirA family biotin operon repressor/biotin-[acetyl-CoA-carboxylase] ligase